jgi:hypothetical protein
VPAAAAVVGAAVAQPAGSERHVMLPLTY